MSGNERKPVVHGSEYKVTIAGDNSAANSDKQNVKQKDSNMDHSVDPRIVPLSEFPMEESEHSLTSNMENKDPVLKIPLATEQNSSTLEVPADAVIRTSIAKPNISSDNIMFSSQSCEDLSFNTSEMQTNSSLDIDECMSNLDSLEDSTMQKNIHIGSKARRKPSSVAVSSRDGILRADETPRNILNVEKDCKRTAPAFSSSYCKSNEDVPTIGNLKFTDEPLDKSAFTKSSELKLEAPSADETVKQAEGDATSGGNPGGTIQHIHMVPLQIQIPETFFTEKINKLSDSLSRIMHLDHHMKLQPLITVEVPFAEKISGSEISDPTTVAAIAKLECEFWRALEKLNNSTEDSECAAIAQVFRNSVSNIRNNLLATTPAASSLLTECDDSNVPVTIDELRKALPNLWKSARLNNLLLKRLIASLLEWCFFDYPMEDLVRFHQFASAILNMSDQVGRVLQSAERLMKRLKRENVSYSATYDLTYMSAIARHTIEIYSGLARAVEAMQFRLSVPKCNDLLKIA